MKRIIRTTYEIQIKLFQEIEISSDPPPPAVAADRKAELKRAIAELLLSVALDDAAVRRGGRHDA
jgi:hypothetical protein